ncbi:isovaleryl-CoA dehydrogenase [Sphaerosporella brunnea]|uniref:Isovaleryl-CoA dehydrogenase n=1 Tax=Sphaerosporella brunnea TaxID=1250544 RepID=A0A5J5ERD6_9PEZI|nr:isovaleryl-CoA dehydrogenase [Sphaerosporella brunnea]
MFLRPLRYLVQKPPRPLVRRRCLSTLIATTNFTETQLTVREAVGKICAQFPDEYWAEHDETGEYPSELHSALAKDGWIGICLPPELGGAGLGISEATMMLQTISESGAGMAGAQSVHANIYATQPINKFATPSQKSQWLAPLIAGQTRTCFGVTEPNSGLDTLSLSTRAERVGDTYRITGSKIWITNADVASHMVLLARTSQPSASAPPSQCLSLFYIPLLTSASLSLRPIQKLGARAISANEVFFDNYEVPASCLIGEEGSGFRQILHGMNAERCLLAGEALGLGYAALEKATIYSRERKVFGHAIGANQSIQHGLADCYMQLEAAKLATYHAAALYDRLREGDGELSAKDVGAAANTAKYLAAEAGFRACERAVMTLGGMGYAKEFHVERYLRESLIPRIAPVSREMVLNYVGEKVLGLPKSY